jgi:fermentation-respiration switch protein FrsA (DUF1100 family)
VLHTVVETALIAYAVVVAALFLFQRNLLYLPDTGRPRLDGLGDLGAREVTLETADGLKLLSWYLPPPDGRPVIVYFHGNGGNIRHRAERYAHFATAHYGVLAVEYRGYGGNPGSPSAPGLYADGAAACDWLARHGVAPDRVVLYGESLGSAVAVHLAADRRVAALILESPFSRLATIAQHHYPFVPVSLLLRDRFDPLSEIGRVTAPILFLQGGRDRVVPPRFGRPLYEAAPEPKELWFTPDGGHVNLARFGLVDAVLDFLRRRLG